MSGRITAIEAELTLQQRYRLIEIAHETRVPEIRQSALALLEAVTVAAHVAAAQTQFVNSVITADACGTQAERNLENA